MSSQAEDQRTLHMFPESKTFLVPNAEDEVIIKIGDYPYGSNLDTASIKYVDIDKTDCHAFVLKANQDFNIKGINGKIFHTPWTHAANLLFTKTRGLFSDITVVSVSANTAFSIWAE